MLEDVRLVRRSLDMLPQGAQRRYRLALVLQSLVNLLDLVGVLLFGILGLLTGALIQDQPVPAVVTSTANALGLGALSTGQLAAIVAVTAAAFFLAKTVISVTIIRGVVGFLARSAAAVSSSLSARFLSMPLVKVREKPSQWSAHALGSAVSTAIINILTVWLLVVADSLLLLLFAVVLLLVEPVTTLVLIAYLALAVVLLNRSLAAWARRTGVAAAETTVQSIASMQDAITTYRETTVTNRRQFYVDRFGNLRQEASKVLADLHLIQQLPRYVLESVVVFGVVLLGALLARTQSLEQVVGTVALYLAAAGRVLPALVRLNSSRLALKNYGGEAELAHQLDDFVRACEDGASASQQRIEEPSATEATSAATPASGVITSGVTTTGVTSSPAVVVRELSVRYPGASRQALHEVSLSVPTGTSLAVVGPSGSGKTTLIDAILGVIAPEHGSVVVEGLPPLQLVARDAHAIAYVPQDVALVTGTVRDNVALAVPPEDVDDEAVWQSLSRAHLADFLRQQRDGLDTEVGERAMRLSGGQRQRLGIARALYCQPRLLVMDEATSALDAETETAVSAVFADLGNSVTTITVAHRLATVRRADAVAYLEEGRLIAMGTFDEVRLAVPSFDRQALLLGL